MNIAELYAAELEMERTFKRNYIAKATAKERESKYFDIGFGLWYGKKDHLALLSQGGFTSVEEYQEAVEKTDWAIAYERFNQVYKLLPYNSAEHKALKADLIAAGLYKEEDQKLRGLEFWAICMKNAPKQSQLVLLTAELGLEWPHSWGN